jgi:hypothetical protein
MDWDTQSIVLYWHRAEVFGVAAISSGNRVTYPVLAGQPAGVLLTQPRRTGGDCDAAWWKGPHYSLALLFRWPSRWRSLSSAGVSVRG